VSFPAGVFPPMLTPFSDGEVDPVKASRYARMLVAQGAHGVCVAGSAGEFVAMDVPERKVLADAVIGAVGDRVPVIVCVAAYRTEHSAELARHAQAAGAAAVMASAPFYMGAHLDAVWRHLAGIRAAVEVPVMLYHVPATTQVELPLEVLCEMVDADVIHAVKQSFYDGYHTRDAKIALGDTAAVFCGHDGSALECLLMGADGWISALPALYPSLARELWDGVLAGQPVTELRTKWLRLLPLVRLIFDPAVRDRRGSPHWLEVMHSAANLLGHDIGSPRAPFADLGCAETERLAAILRAIGAPAADAGTGATRP
jgi:4-hydroxy-tetrahydrodipicolinate synthase